MRTKHPLTHPTAYSRDCHIHVKGMRWHGRCGRNLSETNHRVLNLHFLALQPKEKWETGPLCESQTTALGSGCLGRAQGRGRRSLVAREERRGPKARRRNTLKTVGNVTVLSRVDLDRTGRSWGNSRVTGVQPQGGITFACLRSPAPA